MDKLFTISIALVTYNGGKFLEDQLKSILNQSRLPNEVVICDDRSSDGTIQILEKFAKTAPFDVRIFINEKNLGSTKNFEKCINLCHGDLIFLSDQDDYWLEGKLQRIEQEFLRNPYLKLVFTNGNVVDKELGLLGYTLFESLGFDKRKMKKINQNKEFDVLMSRDVITGCTMAFKKNALKVNRFPEGWIHDAWIGLVIAAIYPGSIKYLNDPLIYYRQHGSNQVGALNWSKLKTKQSLLSYIKKNQFDQIEKAYRNLQNIKNNMSTFKIVIQDKATQKRFNKLCLHYENRMKLNRNIINNLNITFTEFITFRYFKFARGALTLFRDLFFNRKVKSIHH
ncbi:glycosyltransferase family 2 protein [Neobacillus sp. YIM B06451]|uniref:glycosyltransferase family 2 protein n=1 Tax=Neobacillus sp. YIM B06451 TaxID=3070994 RepID=UPI0029311886|nr:glycosyltransferase family 2 protein [Neobacillus sp. YIM B06451]